jgi:triosephosphate isomerase
VRKSLIAGNWKMHGSLAEVKELINGIKQGVHQHSTLSGIDILVLPSFAHLLLVHDLIMSTPILLGAQNLYTGTQGAYTGEVSGDMLMDIGCQYVLVGHSERRSIFHENHSLIAAKFKAAIEAGLKPILCVGETQTERENEETEAVIRSQLESVINLTGIDVFQKAVIAYEPVWAIGTGLTATPEQAQAVHAYIRELIKKNKVDIAETIRILYGGSMKAENAASLLAMPDIDGGLIGGASLDANSFLKICAAGLLKLER